MDRLGFNSIFGMKVHTSPSVVPAPVLQLRPDFPHCTDAFRAEMNAYLLDMFGAREVVYGLGNEMAMSLRGRAEISRAFKGQCATGRSMVQLGIDLAQERSDKTVRVEHVPHYKWGAK